VLLLLRRQKRVQQMSAVAGDADEQTLISISTDAVERRLNISFLFITLYCVIQWIV